jgi:NAD(P)-dependent dehydrogenase (short-subunit alcohol dehydrogenase family)
MSTHFIVGGSSGVGLELVKILSSQNDRVFATYRNSVPQDGLAQWNSLNVLAETIDLSFLPDSIDSFVYCPGAVNLKPFARINPDEFVSDYQLQVIGAVKTIQAALPRLKNSAAASIIMFSTVAVQIGFNFHSLVSSSKGAVEGLTRALAAELAPKIRVNCIAPSITDTPLAASLLNSDQKKELNAQRHPLKKIGQPEDIANLAAFLVSEKSRWMTGQVFHVDGGISSVRVG